MFLFFKKWLLILLYPYLVSTYLNFMILSSRKNWCGKGTDNKAQQQWSAYRCRGQRQT